MKEKTGMSDFNKIITNKAVALTEAEVNNLVSTLAPVVAACSDPVVYEGDGTYIEVNQSQRTIQFLKGNELDAKAEATAVNAALAKKADESALTGYMTTAQYETESAAFALKTEIPTVPTKVTELDDGSNYYIKNETSAASEISTEFAKYAKTADLKTYDVTAQAGVTITTATDDGKVTFGVSLTAEPVVTDTTLSGYSGISANLDATTTSQWNVGLAQDMIATIAGKLDAAVYEAVSATFLTAHQSLENYYTKEQTSAAAQISTEFAKYVKPENLTAYNVSAKSGIVVTTATTDGNVTFGLELTASAGGADVSISGYSGINAALDETTEGQWNIGLTTEINDTIAGKLDTSVYEAASATFLTAHQSLENYYTKKETSGASELSAALRNKQDAAAMTAYLTTADYETDKNSYVTSSTTVITGSKQYALTVDGWTEIAAGAETAYLPLSGGVVSGEVTISGGAFDASYLKFENDADAYSRIGVSDNGAAIKAGNGERTAQISVTPTATNYGLITVQNNGTTVGQLIPAVTATTTADLADDGILHIILDNA